jgi:hypothetical protein
MTAPPRAQGDVTAILDQQKPDPAAAAKMRAEADQPPPAGANPAALARFYYQRGETRSVLGRYNDAIADAQAAFAAGKPRPRESSSVGLRSTRPRKMLSARLSGRRTDLAS